MIIERNIRGMFQSESEEGNDDDEIDARDPTIPKICTLSVSPTSASNREEKRAMVCDLTKEIG